MLVFTRFSRRTERSKCVRYTTVLAAILRRIQLVNRPRWKTECTILVLKKRNRGERWHLSTALRLDRP